MKIYMLVSKNDLFYFCTLVEYIARITNNHRGAIIEKLTDKDIAHELEVASVNHCLTFEQVSDEWITNYKINKGNFDTVQNAEYKIPSYTSIGKVYCNLILDTLENESDLIPQIRKVFNSFISDEISNFNTCVYYSNPSYLKYSFEEGKLLD